MASSLSVEERVEDPQWRGKRVNLKENANRGPKKEVEPLL